MRQPQGWSIVDEAEVLKPDLPQQLNRRDLPQPYRRTRSHDGRKQLMTIATDLLGVGAPLRLALGHFMIASPPVIALQLGRIGLPAQPLGGRCRQGIQGSP